MLVADMIVAYYATGVIGWDAAEHQLGRFLGRCAKRAKPALFGIIQREKFMLINKAKAVFFGLLALGGASTAHAGIIIGSWEAQPNTTTGSWGQFDWSDYAPDSSDPTSSASLAVDTSVALSDPSTYFNLMGKLDSDPSIDVIQKVTNSSNTPWTTLQIGVVATPGETISNLVGAVPPGGATTPYTTSTTLNGDTVIFSGATVQPGSYAWVEVTFDIGLDSYANSAGNLFQYSIVASPNQTTAIPEPVSMASLAGVGGLTLLGRRRKSRLAGQ